MPPIEFEHTKQKIFPLSSTCVALTAGNALRPIEIIPRIQATIAKNSGTAEIANNAKNIYQVLRADHAEDAILKPRSITKEIFYTQGANIFPVGLFQAIDNDFALYRYNLNLLITGVDGGGGHIFSVSDPGVCHCFDSIGFHATGVGDLHATQVFIAHRYKISYSINEAINIVYAAKKAAEVAPGVGSATDMLIINQNEVAQLHDEVMSEIENIYSTESISPIDQITNKTTRLNKFIEDLTKKDIPEEPKTEEQDNAENRETES